MLERETDYEKKKTKSSENNVQNLNNAVKGILLFWDNMPNKKPEDPNEILA